MSSVNRPGAAWSVTQLPIRRFGLVAVAFLLLLTSACTFEFPPSQTAVPSQAPSPPTPLATPQSSALPNTSAARATAAPPILAQATAAQSPAATAAQRTVNSPAAEVYRANGASVVQITSAAVVRTFNGTQAEPQGTGSGFVIDNQGHIVTNNHVIEAADQLTVTFQDKTIVPAELIGRDPDNDLAVIKVDPNSTDDQGRRVADKLKPVNLGDSSRVVIGEDAIAIGAPLGLEQTVTLGIVSAIRLPGEEVAGGDLGLLGGAVQTDAAINPGNSGGPLFNAAGEVIGVNAAGLTPTGGSIGLGFAIPVNVVKRVSPALVERGCYEHPVIGISALSLSQLGQSTKNQLGLPVNQRGLLVQEVAAGAAQAGIRVGNRQVSVGGERVRV
ncbi:MAG: S1C family serine protease, partial [Chloroflexota bacterium]